MLKITPIYDRVIIKLDDHTNKHTAGGLVLPVNENTKTNSGIIVQIGIGTLSKDASTIIPPIVKIGQRATFSSYSAIPIETNDLHEKLVCIREGDILFVEN